MTPFSRTASASKSLVERCIHLVNGRPDLTIRKQLFQPGATARSRHAAEMDWNLKQSMPQMLSPATQHSHPTYNATTRLLWVPQMPKMTRAKNGYRSVWVWFGRIQAPEGRGGSFLVIRKCLLSLPFVIAFCHCLLSLPIVIAYFVLLLLQITLVQRYTIRSDNGGYGW